MYRQFVISLLGLGIFGQVLFKPAQAAPAQTLISATPSQSIECRVALLRSRAKLEAKNIRVVRAAGEKHTRFIGYPANRSQQYVFAMKGEGVQALSTSSSVMQAITKDIVSNCKSIGLVIFSVDQTDEFFAYGIFIDGKIKRFQCMGEQPSSARLPWGYEYCP